jgi:hypothetical protein
MNANILLGYAEAKSKSILKIFSGPLNAATKSDFSVSPEVLESIRTEFGIFAGVLHVRMTLPQLQAPYVMAPVDQTVARRVPEHMNMSLNPEIGLGSDPFKHLGKARRSEGSPALSHEDELARRGFATLRAVIVLTRRFPWSARAALAAS